MVASPDVRTIFDDAYNLYKSAVDMVANGDLRDAAEKAWGAVHRATTALVLARTDILPERSPDVTDGLLDLADDDYRLVDLRQSYFSLQGLLHGQYFYKGRLGKPSTVESEIHRAGDYIQQAERWADG